MAVFSVADSTLEAARDPLPRVAEVVQDESVNDSIQTKPSSICGEGLEQNAGPSTLKETEQQQLRLQREVEKLGKPSGCHNNHMTDMDCE